MVIVSSEHLEECLDSHGPAEIRVTFSEFKIKDRDSKFITAARQFGVPGVAPEMTHENNALYAPFTDGVTHPLIQTIVWSTERVGNSLEVGSSQVFERRSVEVIRAMERTRKSSLTGFSCVEHDRSPVLLDHIEQVECIQVQRPAEQRYPDSCLPLL